ncbi:MAG: tetratricopeptide repeat protein [Moorea sp. SIO3C2]|nr:tetratricopeptide repeat protein [Moorena sp. SIO3C2]
MASFNKAIDIESDYPSTYLWRGVTYVRLREYEQAISDISTAINLDCENGLKIRKQDYPIAYDNRGNAYYNLKNYQSAIKDYNRAIQLKPDYVNACFNLGVVYHKLNNYEEALSQYNKCLRLEENYWIAFSNIGLIKYEMNKPSSAMVCWEQAVTINNNEIEPQLAFAVALYAQGQQEEGLKKAKEALKLDDRWEQIEFLRQNLWGDVLLTDAQQLLNDI